MKAEILIQYNGKTYRVGKSQNCSSKRNCDLFQRGWCGNLRMIVENGFPCSDISDAFVKATGENCKFCFKEVRGEGGEA